MKKSKIEMWKRGRLGEKQMELSNYNKPLVVELPEGTIKKTYSQNWKEYNRAKTNEAGLFNKILQELLFLSIGEDIFIRPGRKPYNLKDRIFCLCIKAYYKSDLRKCESILKELQRIHYLERVPCFKTIDNFFHDEKLSQILDDLILITALPLANLEETGAIDATGFSTSKFARWTEYKWGKNEGKERVWRKAHAVVGCLTNVFISVEVTRKNVHDAKMFEDVVCDKIKFFNLDTFVGDKAYSSRRILNFINKLGIIPFIPFKKNTKVPGGVNIWKDMFMRFKHENEDFMKKYHTRSNVETSFSMVKQKFGDSLSTKSFLANTNEIKIRFLCHNICVLIQEAFERNILPNLESCVKKVKPV